MKSRVTAQLHLFAALWLFLLAATAFAASPQSLVIDDFNSGLQPHWEQKRFQGQTQYAVIEQAGEKVLMARSDAAASALVFKKKYSLGDYPILSWRWKVESIIREGDARAKSGDDYAARIYVVFPHWFVPMTRSINYIWANKLQKEAHLPSRYAANSVMVAVQSGAENVGLWISERRNVREDYIRIFGKEPPAVGAIAIMTDTDDTGDIAIAWYDDLRITRE